MNKKELQQKNLKRLLEEKGFKKQEEFAKAIFSTQQTVSLYVSGTRPISKGFKNAILKAFPDVREQFLEGYDAYMTDKEMRDSITLEAMTSNQYNQFFFDVIIGEIKAMGYEYTNLCDEATIKETTANTIEDIYDAEALVSVLASSEFYKFTKEERTITFSVEEFNSFIKEIRDYIDFRLLHMSNN